MTLKLQCVLKCQSLRPIWHLYYFIYMYFLYADSQEKAGHSQAASRDPIEFCSHIPSEVRKTQQRIALEEAEKSMDEEAKAREREIQHEQLAAIFSLMEQQKEKFGVESMDDIQEQMKLYTAPK